MKQPGFPDIPANPEAMTWHHAHHMARAVHGGPLPVMNVVKVWARFHWHRFRERLARKVHPADALPVFNPPSNSFWVEGRQWDLDFFRMPTRPGVYAVSVGLFNEAVCRYLGSQSEWMEVAKLMAHPKQDRTPMPQTTEPDVSAPHSTTTVIMVDPEAQPDDQGHGDHQQQPPPDPMDPRM